MINLAAASIELCITHTVGNRLQDEPLVLSEDLAQFSEATEGFFLAYLLGKIDEHELYRFTHPTDLALNAVAHVASKLFAAKGNTNRFIEYSAEVAKLLYEQSMHPKIKTGKLHVVCLKDVLIEDEAFEAVGIFKSETEEPFLTVEDTGPSMRIQHEFGYDLKGIDKASLIVNTLAEDGYRLLVFDRKNTDTRYWVDDFLQARPVATAYQQTSQAMSLTRTFLSKEAPKQFEIEKTEQMALLNSAADYFAKKETYNRAEFEEEILQDERLIGAFRDFNAHMTVNDEAPFSDEFEINGQAYKKQSKIFKSVLKLDRNFHIYIHGDRELISRGVEQDGRKFYKVYYDEER